MMFHEFFERLAPDGSVKITETLSQVKLDWTVAGDPKHVLAETIEQLRTVSSRDRYELLVDRGETPLSILLENLEEQGRLQTYLENTDDSDETHFVLTINKRVVHNKISVYFLDKLATSFKATPFADLLKSFAALFADRLEFEVFGNLTPFSTSSIAFSKAGSTATIPTIGTRLDRLEAFTNNTNALGLPPRFLPSDFFLVSRSELDSFNKFFDNASAILSLAFLSNSSELREPDSFSYRIYGYKAVICSDVKLEDVGKFAKILHEIYSWSYEGGSAADKLGLVRNVLSIHLNDAGEPQFDSFVWEAIRSNYQIYLKGNIQSYLEVKNKISDLLFESVTRTSKLADEILDSLKNSIFIIATFLLTVVVINGLKDSNFEAIFSTPYLLIVSFLGICSLLWMRSMRKDTVERYHSAADAMEEVLHTNYDKFLMHAEIEGSLRPTLNRNEKNLKAQIAKYCRWWLVMLTLFFALFAIGNLWFVQVAPAMKKNKATIHQPEGTAAPAAPNRTNVEKSSSTASQATQQDVQNRSIPSAPNTAIRKPYVPASGTVSQPLATPN